MPPIITMYAPAPIAFATSPAVTQPPSDITSMLYILAADATFKIALSCGIPTPTSDLVLHAAPLPTPTFNKLAPASCNFETSSGVAILPAEILMCGK